jgi:two-component system chemotaxis response regulator CheB
MSTIRCLIADDSSTFRGILRGILAKAPELEVVGEAVDGVEALQRTMTLRPDVVAMDVEMPRRTGLQALRDIMRVAPTPVVVLSATGGTQSLAFEALRLGAIEVLPKPRPKGPVALERQAEDIRTALRTAGALVLSGRKPLPTPAPRPVEVPRYAEVLGIAASTGGPAALARILSALPSGYPLPILVVQHMAAGFESGLVAWLATESKAWVKLAEDGEPLEPGTVYVGSEGLHLAVRRGTVRLEDGPARRGLKPSADHLFASLAAEYGRGAAGLVLSGMGDDGAEGLALVRQAGGFAAAQGPATSVVYGMPRAALESGAAQTALELDEIPRALARLAGAA